MRKLLFLNVLNIGAIIYIEKEKKYENAFFLTIVGEIA